MYRMVSLSNVLAAGMASVRRNHGGCPVPDSVGSSQVLNRPTTGYSREWLLRCNWATGKTFKKCQKCQRMIGSEKKKKNERERERERETFMGTRRSGKKKVEKVLQALQQRFLCRPHRGPRWTKYLDRSPWRTPYWSNLKEPMQKTHNGEKCEEKVEERSYYGLASHPIWATWWGKEEELGMQK